MPNPDSAGTAAGDHVTAFHRLFGDTDGGTMVDLADLDTLFTTHGSTSCDAGYLWYLDHDGDVDYDDWLAFRQRYVAFL